MSATEEDEDKYDALREDYEQLQTRYSTFVEEMADFLEQVKHHGCPYHDMSKEQFFKDAEAAIKYAEATMDNSEHHVE